MIPKRILPVIITAQFLCTSLWFATNGVLKDLIAAFSLEEHVLGHLTAAVQLGFIIGTLVFAILTIADRFSPSKVFFVCALLGAFFNLGILWSGNTVITLLVIRFLVGFSLAGIYPIGMKIAADYYKKGLGKSLGFLVGALVLGTAFPHFLNIFSATLSWKFIIISTSILAFVGGSFIVLFIPNGPYRTKNQQPQLSDISKVFKNQKFRTAAYGYFGHMWELYAFWALVPIMIQSYNVLTPKADLPVSYLSFLVIGIGSLGCIISGYVSQRFGEKATATLILTASACCCLVVPFLFFQENTWLFVTFLMFWGLVVIADSPLFSTLIAKNTTGKLKGTALTIANSIGFAITIISIQILNLLWVYFENGYVFMVLVLGPIFGLLALTRQEKKD